MVSTWSILRHELQAEVSGRPRKTTGNQTQVRKIISHSLPSLNT